MTRRQRPGWSLALAILVAGAALVGPRPAARAQTPALASCPSDPPWLEDRDELGGSYIANGWVNGLMMVLRLTAIGGNVQGFFMEVETDDFGEIDETTYSVTGIYDDSQISLQIEQFLATVTMVGSWDSYHLDLSYPGSDGGVSSAGFYAIDDDAALDLVNLWKDRAPRDDAGNMALGVLESAYQSLPFTYDLSTPPQRIFVEDAPTRLMMPDWDSLSLLSFGWLASAEFTARPEGNLPNQVNRYLLHFTRSLGDSVEMARCAKEAFGNPDNLEPVDDQTDFDRLYVYEDPGTSDIPGHIDVLAIAGSTVVLITAYGDDEIRQSAIGTARFIAILAHG